MLHPLPLPLSSCLGCIPPLIGLPSLRFYAVGSSLFLLSVCFCLCSLFYRDDVLCWLLLARPFLYAFHAHLRFPVDLVWFRLSCDHGWIRSGSVNVRKQQQQQQLTVFLPSSAAASIYFCQHHTPSGQSRAYRVTQLRTDCVHCNESVGTGPVVLKVVRVTGAAFASPRTKCYCAPLFSHTHYWYTVCTFKLSGVYQNISTAVV